MPNRKTIARARRDARQGKSPSTQAGEFVREEMHHIRQGKHGARSTKQAIAIGLSQARRAGVRLPPPPGKRSGRTRESIQRDYGWRHGRSKPAPPPPAPASGTAGTTSPRRSPTSRRTSTSGRTGDRAAHVASLSRGSAR